MSKIIRVDNGDYKVVSVRDDGNRGFISIHQTDETGEGTQEYPNLARYPGGMYSRTANDALTEGFSVTIHTGNELRTGTVELTGSLMIHGDTLYTSNPTFYILDKDVKTVEFAGDTTVLTIGSNDQSTDSDPTSSTIDSTQTVNIVNSRLSTSQTVDIANSTTPIQTIDIGTSTSSTSQTVNIADASVTPTQFINLANLSTGNTTQTISLGNSISSASQTINIGNSSAPTQTVELFDSTSTTRQDVDIANSTTPIQTIDIGVSNSSSSQTIRIGVSSVGTSTIDIADSTATVRQDVDIANSITPIQTIDIGTSTTSTSQTVNIANASVTPTQLINIANLATGNTTQTINIGNSAAPTQTVELFDSTSTTRQDVDIANSTTPIQTIDIGNSTSTTSQTVNAFNATTATHLVNIANASSATTSQTINIGVSSNTGTQTVNIGNVTTPQTISIGNSSTQTSTYNLGTGPTASGQTKTVNIGSGGTAGSTTNVNLATGAGTGGTTTIGSATVLGEETTQNLWNTVATTVNAFGAATLIDIGATTGVTSINHNLDVDLDVNIDGGDLTTNQTSFNVLTTNATTVNAFLAATSIDIGASTGITSVNNNLDVDLDVNIDGGDLTTNQTTFNLLNTNATTVNAFGTATTINIGSGSQSGDGLTTIRHDVVILGDLTVQGDTTTINTETLTVEDKNIQLAFLPNPGDRTDLTAEAGGITLMGTTNKTLNWYGASNAWTSNVNFDLTTGNVYKINNIEVLSYNGVLNNEATITAFAQGTAIELGANSGTLTLRNPTVVGTQTTQNLWNTVATTVNAFGAATTIEIGAATGTTNINNKLDVDLDIEVGGDIYPTLDGVSDLGKNTFRFKDLYLSGNTIYLGDSTISSVTSVSPHNSIVTNSNADFNNTGYLKLPKGTEAQRPGEVGQPTAEAGQMRFNTTGIYFEGYDGIKWKRLGVDIDQIEQYGSLATFIMDRYEYDLYKSAVYTVQMQNPLSNHSFNILVTHNDIYTDFEISNEVIMGAKVADISTRLLNGFVEVLVTPFYESTEIAYSKVLLDNTSPVEPTGITEFPTDVLDTFDLQVTDFDIDLVTLENSNIDLNNDKTPGYGGTLPLSYQYTNALDLQQTSYEIDFEDALVENLINNNGLVDLMLNSVIPNEADKIDLSAFYYYIHPALPPAVIELPSTP
jgi:hypothetical protein